MWTRVDTVKRRARESRGWLSATLREPWAAATLGQEGRTMHDPPAGAELHAYRDSPDVPVSRHRPGPGADLVALVWTPDPRSCSHKTEWRAVTEGPPISRAEFDELRRSFGRAARYRRRADHVRIVARWTECKRGSGVGNRAESFSRAA